ncbi:hypothetical protein FH969_02755 [Miniimonas arenae]|uniref:Uncharacterized protein n=1 Tax=Miniimonas arenae TaxID=676201 RepID=A0A5C5BEW6_9MICO|nr:hypothetical protein [Miniimonas arenae]TNU76626.1 hypothetical protein FH969_02755 [Miniimonas arenae]
MALMSWLRRLAERHDPEGAKKTLTHRETTPREDELRAVLAADPNDEDAFDALVEIVRERADEGTQPDPLIAEHVDPQVRQNHAVWALAEELAGQPRAWLPLIVLARLSLGSDHEAAMRRLSLACERETTGLALTHAVAMLRDAGASAEAIAFGVAHWELASRDVEAGREIVLAALESGRVAEARRLLDSLLESSGSPRLDDVEDLVAYAEKEQQA